MINIENLREVVEFKLINKNEIITEQNINNILHENNMFSNELDYILGNKNLYIDCLLNLEVEINDSVDTFVKTLNSLIIGDETSSIKYLNKVNMHELQNKIDLSTIDDKSYWKELVTRNFIKLDMINVYELFCYIENDECDENYELLINMINDSSFISTNIYDKENSNDEISDFLETLLLLDEINDEQYIGIFSENDEYVISKTILEDNSLSRITNHEKIEYWLNHIINSTIYTENEKIRYCFKTLEERDTIILYKFINKYFDKYTYYIENSEKDFNQEILNIIRLNQKLHEIDDVKIFELIDKYNGVISLSNNEFLSQNSVDLIVKHGKVDEYELNYLIGKYSIDKYNSEIVDALEKIVLTSDFQLYFKGVEYLGMTEKIKIIEYYINRFNRSVITTLLKQIDLKEFSNLINSSVDYHLRLTTVENTKDNKTIAEMLHNKKYTGNINVLKNGDYLRIHAVK